MFMSYANESITQSCCRDNSDYEYISHIKMGEPTGGITMISPDVQVPIV